LKFIEVRPGSSVRVAFRSHQDWCHGTDEDGFGDAVSAVAAEITHHLASARRMAHVYRVLDIEMSDKRRAIVCVMAHIVTGIRLGRRSMTTTIMGYVAMAVGQEEQQLRPDVGRQRSTGRKSIGRPVPSPCRRSRCRQS
jgi:hypothetical protein